MVGDRVDDDEGTPCALTAWRRAVLGILACWARWWPRVGVGAACPCGVDGWARRWRCRSNCVRLIVVAWLDVASGVGQSSILSATSDPVSHEHELAYAWRCPTTCEAPTLKYSGGCIHAILIMHIVSAGVSGVCLWCRRLLLSLPRISSNLLLVHLLLTTYASFSGLVPTGWLHIVSDVSQSRCQPARKQRKHHVNEEKM